MDTTSTAVNRLKWRVLLVCRVAGGWVSHDCVSSSLKVSSLISAIFACQDEQ